MTNADWQQSDKSKFSGRFFFANSHDNKSLPLTNLGGPTAPGFPVTTANRFRNVSVTHSYLLNSHLLNQAEFAYNRQFVDVPQDQPEVHAEPGFEREVHAFNLFGYLSRSDVTWNPSVCSVVKDSLFCPTSEEYILPVEHGNDRCEWFITLSDEIIWNIKDGATGRPKAVVKQRAGDCACMPADIRHQGFSAKRAMLLVWENGSPKVPDLIRAGKAPNRST